MKVGSLFAEIGFKVDKNGLDTFTNAMKSFQRTVRSGLKDLREYAKVAREISYAARNMYIPTQQEARSRYRANTAYIRSTARQNNAWARQTRASSNLDVAKAELLFKRAKTWERDSETRAKNADSRARTVDQRERGIISSARSRSGYTRVLSALAGGAGGGGLGSTIGALMGVIGGPIGAAIALGVRAIVGAIMQVVRTVREGVRIVMAYRDYRSFTGRSTRSLYRMMGAALSTTSMSPEDIMRDAMGLEKSYWDMFFGGGNPRAWQMMGILPTGRGDIDLRNILASVYGATGGFQNRGMARSLLGQFGLNEEYIQLWEAFVRQNPEETFENLFRLFDEQVRNMEEANKTLKEFDEIIKNLKVVLASIIVSIVKAIGWIWDKLKISFSPDSPTLQHAQNLTGINLMDTLTSGFGQWAGSVVQNNTFNTTVSDVDSAVEYTNGVRGKNTLGISDVINASFRWIGK